jgi:PadR family transcriptional regulator, regulatory protein AphA
MSVSTGPPELTATSYAVLGLLSIKDWSAYEFVREMERGWSDIWPRAASGIYREPKKLVQHGYAACRTEHTGRRRRTMYTITPLGLEALRSWLTQPADVPRLEAEVLVRAAFAEHGRTRDLLEAAWRVRSFAVERSLVYLRIGDEYRATEPRFPERMHSILLVSGFLARYFAALIDWATWVENEVAQWDGIATAEDVPGIAQMQYDVRALFESNISDANGSDESQ